MGIREMKDSGIEWIGMIPKDWEVCRHKDIMYRVKEIEVNYKGQDIISLTMNGVIIRDLSLGGKIPLTFDGYQKVYQGNLLLCLFDIDVTPRCVGLIKNNGVTSPAYCQFAMHNQVCAPYYDYLLRYIDDKKCMLHLSKNLRSSLTETDFGAIYTVYPPFSTQQRIATFLDEKCKDIDTLITLQEKMIAELQAYKQSVISEAVTKGLNPNVPMKDSGVEWIGEIPEHWRISKLKQESTMVLGKMLESKKPLNTTEEYSMQYYLKSRNIGTLELYNDITNVDQMWFSERERDTYLLKEGDIVMNEGGDIGKVALWKDAGYNCYIQNSVHKISPITTSMNSPYLQYVLFYVNVKGYFKSIVNSISIAHLTKEKLSGTSIIVPPLSEQQAIANYLDTKCAQIDELIALKQQKITELQDYKKSLIYEYVTGKKEVPANN